jgi:HD-GYP domain-containing protein (c-di-GMP phosphodiesterase class II)
MKKLVPVNQLKFGVYIHELDRPWTETPFMFQGFVLQNDKQLEALKKFCKKVFIDTEKGTDVSNSTPFTGGPFTGGPVTGVLATIEKKQTYVEKAPFKTEVPIARQTQKKTELVLKDVFSSVQAGKAIDAPRVKEAVSSMTDSVVRNPDAMLLLAKMKETGGHTLDRAMGVSIYMITFGRFLHLPREQLDMLGMLGLLQDVGKVRLPPELLNKKDPLSEAELNVCKSHVRHSVAILKETTGLPPDLPALAALHHERVDGSGYPKGMKGPEIGLFGGIAGLIDCFDALTGPRPYGQALPPSNALNMLYDWREIQFDGPLVEQFIQCIGIYPVGALVELYSGEVGIVIAQNPVMRLLPRVMVVLDSKGQPIKPARTIDRAQVKRTLEKGSVPIDPSEYFI